MRMGLGMCCGVVMAIVLGVVSGCTQSGNGNDSQNANGTSSTTTSNGLPEGIMLTSMPEGARSVGEVKGMVQQGDEVAIRGRIGGSRDPFVEGRAAFTIVDSSLKACSDIPGDKCPRPWDYCCEPAESLARNSATITVVSADGKPLPTSLSGVNGLKELSDVVIVGTVAQAEGNILLIHAQGIHIVAQ